MNKNPKGYIALITVLILSVVALSTASTVSLLAIGEAQTSLAMNQGEENLQLVEGCVEDALLKAWASSSYNGGNITRPEGTCIITVAKNGIIWTITATSTATSFNRTVQVTISRSTGIVMNSWNETLTIPTPTPTPTLAATPTPTITPTPTPIPGRVGHWKFNEGSGTTAADSSGSGNNGTLTNGPTWIAGQLGQALNFDGVNDFVHIGDPANGSLDFGTGSFSYGMWVYNTRSINWENPWFKGGQVASQVGYLLETNVNGQYAMLGDGATNPYAFFSAPTILNQWVHIMAVVDRSTNRLKAYRNGVLNAQTDITGFGSMSNSQPARIGADHNGNLSLSGKIDDVRVYNRALSAAEVLAIYNGAP